MKIEQVMPNKYDYFDRYPQPVLLTYNGIAIAPHAQTTREAEGPFGNFLYMVHGIYLFVRRVTAATTVGSAVLRVFVRGLVVEQEVCRVWLEDNAVGAKAELAYPISFVVIPGWSIEIDTQDSSTGGTVSYFASIMTTGFMR